MTYRSILSTPIIIASLVLWCLMPLLALPPHMAGALARKGAAAGGGGGFTYYSTEFDASTYLTRGAELTGIVDGQQGTASFWIKMTAASSDTAFYYIIMNGAWLGTNYRFRIYRDNSARMITEGYRADGTLVAKVQTFTNVVTKAAGWTHIAMSWDLSSGIARHCYVNGVTGQVAPVFTVGETIDYVHAGDWGFGGSITNESSLVALVSEFYFDDSYIDLSNASNLAKFISGGKPVDLSAESPLIYFPDPYNTFPTNSGTGGDFSVGGGALIDGGADKP